ncbi:uncharacterized protein Dana_GF14971 [Drosophila ananassae]|uniref:Peptidase S1 domain-containing protein n=2 Tax=Drosophila ananassae TaxID=7217 RepID=B3ML12_DROAN|nr:uncharacterized protein Dana_GF14971 [Drosophila ananassae]
MQDQCGLTNVDGLYMTVESSGQETSFTEYPWLVAILDSESKQICSGVLISHKVVLSAASCLPPTQNLTVRAGDWDLLSDSEIVPHENRLVEKIIVHNDLILSQLLNDLALAVLESAFPRTKHIVPVCMFDDLGSSRLNATRCFAIGWNVLKFTRFLPQENIVLKIAVDTTTALIKKPDGRIKAHISAHRHLNLMGSPLVCPTEGNQYFLLGIWSYQLQENQTVFANVTRNLQWINDHL